MSANVAFTNTTSDSVNREGPYVRVPTRHPRQSLESGWVHPGTKNRVPMGSQTADGRFTGDYRGLGVVNPWGGRTRRNKKCGGKKGMSKRCGGKKGMSKRMRGKTSRRMTKRKTMIRK